MKKLFFALIAVTLFSCGTQQEKTKVTLNLAEGETYYQTFIMNGSMTQQMMGQEMVLNMNSTVRYRFDVTKKDEEGYDMLISYDKMLLEMSDDSGMTANFSYDSDVDDTTIMSKVFKSFIGESFKARVNPDGSIARVEGLEELFNKVLNKIPEMSAEERMQVAQQIRSQFGEEQLKQNMQYMVTFPEEGIALDDTWTDTLEISQFKGGYNTTYTVKEITDEKVVLNVHGQMKMNEMPNMPPNVDSVDIDGDIKFEQVVDRNTGWNKSMDGKMIIAMRMVSMGMDVTSHMDFTIKGFSGK